MLRFLLKDLQNNDSVDVDPVDDPPRDLFVGYPQLVTARAVTEVDEVVITSSDGIVIRQEVGDINRYGRNSMGVRVMNLAEGATLSALAVAARNGDE